VVIRSIAVARNVVGSTVIPKVHSPAKCERKIERFARRRPEEGELTCPFLDSLKGSSFQLSGNIVRNLGSDRHASSKGHRPKVGSRSGVVIIDPHRDSFVVGMPRGLKGHTKIDSRCQRRAPVLLGVKLCALFLSKLVTSSLPTIHSPAGKTDGLALSPTPGVRSTSALALSSSPCSHSHQQLSELVQRFQAQRSYFRLQTPTFTTSCWGRETFRHCGYCWVTLYFPMR